MALAIISHRGLCRARPRSRRRGENTVEAFAAGLEALEALGMPPAIEFDVRRAADGRLVVIHDATLGRARGVRGRVSAHSAAELAALGVPKLEEVLERFGDAELHLELKERGIAEQVAGVVRASRAGERVVASSFLWRELPGLRGRMRIALTSAFPTKRLVRSAAEMGAWAVHPDYRRTSARLVQMAKSEGLRVHPWTVNTPRAYARMERLGVDAVFSDNPFLLLAPGAVKPRRGVLF
jgi:glycerophosphoryl diester phosphodiesterase